MYVYILRSSSHAEQTYVGATPDIHSRLTSHNNGLCTHTAKFIPWDIETYIWIKDEKKAFLLERYLKTGSGRAFRKKHL